MTSWFSFGRKQQTEPSGPADGAGAESASFSAQPEKARAWFEHAKVAALQNNHAYALHLYASGIKLDPSNLDAHQAMWESAVQYYNAQGKAASGKEIRDIDGPSPVDRFAAAEFAWMKSLGHVGLAIKMLEAAGKAGLTDFGRWIAPRVKNIVFRQKKPAKRDFVAAKDAFASVGAWDEAFQCGEAAVRLDPSDNALLAELKELTAQRAIAAGGYAESAGREGGFRGSVRDAEKQRALEEQESLSGSAEAEARKLDRAKAEYEANPLSPEAVTRYVQALRRTPEGEETAHAILIKAFQELREFRFKMTAGDIRIAQIRREITRHRDAIDAAADDPAARAAAEAALEDARKRLLALEIAEYRERVERYPTDKAIKFELGRLEFEQSNFEEAMPHFQAAKEDARFRVNAAWMLGRCFAALGWHQEAIGEFREAIQTLDASDRDRELEIKYDLMNSLMNSARADGSLSLAKEAADICSLILRRNIGFRDIRTRRKEVDQLVRDLGGTVG